MTSNSNEVEILRAELTAVKQRVEALEAKRSGRKRVPIVVSELGVCGIDPERDAASCPDASIYRRQQGCKGTACMNITSAYWANYRNNEKNK